MKIGDAQLAYGLAHFHGNPPCGLPPAPPGMKMGLPQLVLEFESICGVLNPGEQSDTGDLQVAPTVAPLCWEHVEEILDGEGRPPVGSRFQRF